MSTRALRHFVRDATDGPFGSALKGDSYVDEGARVIRLGNIGSASWRDADAAFVPLDYWRQLRRHEASAGDLIIAGLGDENNPVGRACVLPEVGPSLVKADCFRVRVAADKADARFLAWYLSSSAGSASAEQLADGSTRKRLTLGKALSIAIPDLPRGAQTAIADYLDTETARIDALIAKKKRMIDASRERQEVSESAAVLAAGSQATPIPTIPTVPAGWRVLRNKVFMREVNKPSPDGAEEMLSVSHLTGVTPRSEKTVYMFEAESTVGYKMVQPGDLVINTMWAWMGAAGVARVPGIVSPAYGVYRIDPTVMTPDYFDIVVRTSAYITEMTRYSRGVTSSRLRLYPEEFLGRSSPVPPLEEQRRIVDWCFAARARTITLVECLERQISLLREHRQALITAAVTGELVIPGVAA